MSHGIVKPIDQVFSTQGSEWHKLATEVPAITEKEFLSLSPKIREGKAMVEIDGTTVEMVNHKVLVADYRAARPDLCGTSNEFVPLHIPKNGYRPIENREVIELLQSSLKDVLDNGAKITCAGTLEAGKKFFASVDLNQGEMSVRTKLGSDKILSNLNFVTSHDGTLGLRAYDSMIRIVCMNTLRWSLEAQGEVGFSVYHTQGADVKIANLEALLANIMSGRENFVSQMEELAKMDATTESLRHIPLGYFLSLQGEKGKEELATRSQNAAEEITRLAYRGKGNQGGTLYDLLNGATEYWTSGEGTGKNSSATERLYKASFAGAADHKTRFANGLLHDLTRNEWQNLSRKMNQVISFAG
jgi:hypothetical protein